MLDLVCGQRLCRLLEKLQDGKPTDFMMPLFSSQFPLVDVSWLFSLENSLHISIHWIVCLRLNNGTPSWKSILDSKFFNLFSKPVGKVNVHNDYRGCPMLLYSLTVKIMSHELQVINLKVLYKGETGTELHFINIILAAIWILNWSGEKLEGRR